MKLKYLFLLTLFINSSLTYSQNKCRTEIKYAVTRNTAISQALNSFIESEKKCSYYHDSLIIVMNNWFEENQNYLNITIESVPKYVFSTKSIPFGFLTHNGHYVFLEGEIISDLYSLSDSVKSFPHLFKYNKMRMSTDTLELINDDSYSIWFYIYKRGDMQYIEGTPYCPRKK